MQSSQRSEQIFQEMRENIPHNANIGPSSWGERICILLTKIWGTHSICFPPPSPRGYACDILGQQCGGVGIIEVIIYINCLLLLLCYAAGPKLV